MSEISVVIVPAAPGLLPRWTSVIDPLAEVRGAALSAVEWLAERAENIEVVAADATGVQIAQHLVAGTASSGRGTGLLVVADGSARRGERAPGHLDERAHDFDAAITEALRTGDLATLRGLDLGLAAELLVAGAPVLRELGKRLTGVTEAHLDYAADPFGVQYWVARWEARTG